MTTNQGKQTPGVDNVAWDTPAKKAKAIEELHHRRDRPRPVRQVAIPKKDGRTRDLGIPTMRDRAMQALYVLALDPVAETLADPELLWISLRKIDCGCDPAMLLCVGSQDLSGMGFRR